VIYGTTPPVAETQVGAGFDVADNRSRGYLTGTAFSAWEPDGEGGDTHVSVAIPISRTVFLLAKVLDWPTYSMLREGENIVLGALLADAERKSLGRE
jgi:hypothetical protein